MASTSEEILEDEWFEEEMNKTVDTEPEKDDTNSKNGESNADASANSLETSVSMPSELLQAIDSKFSLGGQEFFLNNCGSKRLIVGITCTVMPTLKVIFKLHDLKNNYVIEFSKKSWDTIVNHEAEISDNLYSSREDEVFDNNHIRVETQSLYDRMCVQFYDVNETHVALASDTFERLMDLKGEVNHVSKELTKKIKDVSKRFKLFMDLSLFMLFKSNNIDNRHNYNWLMLMMNKSTNFMDLSQSISNTWEQLGNWLQNDGSAPNPEVQQ